MITKIKIRKFATVLLSFGLLIISSLSAKAAPGDLDTTFGVGGKVTTETGFSDSAKGIALQGDGRIVVALNKGIARYSPDGALEQTFGYTIESYTDVAIQPDGKIVTVGNYFSPFGCGAYRVYVRRFNSDGTADTSFGVSNGFTSYLPSGCGDGAFAHSITVHWGKIIVAGRIASDNGNDFLALRLNSDGTFDTGFSQDGVGVYSIGSDDTAFDVAVHPRSGRIALVGYTTQSSQKKAAMVMLRSDGLYDFNFGNFGKVITDFDSSNQVRFLSVAFQYDGRIVAGGFSDNNHYNIPFFAFLVRYNANGTFDTTFSNDGKIFIDYAMGAIPIEDVAEQPDGKIVAAAYGRVPNGGTIDFIVYRFNSDGSTDSTFGYPDPAFGGIAGKQIADFDGGTDHCPAMKIQPDGKIILVGSTNNGAESDIALARFLP
ncbi:MAG: hypothetical protein M3209_12545 [Acidobacteriota bacterium]|nr:hypothetical protein [Acidobacteriota bacterium]